VAVPAGTKVTVAMSLSGLVAKLREGRDGGT
jgi:hypothetical protein